MLHNLIRHLLIIILLSHRLHEVLEFVFADVLIIVSIVLMECLLQILLVKLIILTSVSLFTKLVLSATLLSQYNLVWIQTSWALAEVVVVDGGGDSAFFLKACIYKKRKIL